MRYVMTDNRMTELRGKLDELGIEHFDYDKGGRTQTQWEAPDGKRHFTYETSDNPAKTTRLVIAWHPTPEQAIAATLGSGTCENVDKPPSFRFTCSECGCRVYYEDYYGEPYMFVGECAEVPRFCPNCGAKVVTP